AVEQTQLEKRPNIKWLTPTLRWYADDRIPPTRRYASLDVRAAAAADQRQRIFLRARRTTVPGNEPACIGLRTKWALSRPHRNRTARRSGEHGEVRCVLHSAIPRWQWHLAPG